MIYPKVALCFTIMPWYIASNFGFFSLSPPFLYSYAHALMPIYVIQLFMLASNALSTPCSTYFSQKRSAVHFISCFRLFLVKKIVYIWPCSFCVFKAGCQASFCLVSFFSTTIYTYFLDFSRIWTRTVGKKASILTTWPPPRPTCFLPLCYQSFMHVSVCFPVFVLFVFHLSL